jgi:hypothetical protein
MQTKDSDFDSVSDEVCKDALVHQVLGTVHLGLPPWTKRLPALTKISLQAALQAAESKRGFTLCLRNWTLTTLTCNRDFMKIFHLTQTIQNAMLIMFQ